MNDRGLQVSRHKLERHFHMLRQPELTITDIATFTGFCDLSHFIRVFHDREDLTPEVFRRQIPSPEALR